MPVITNYLHGNPEPFSDTLRKLLFSNWDTSKTKNIKPLFRTPGGYDDITLPIDKKVSSADWLAFESKNLIRLHDGQSMRQNPDSMANNVELFVTTVYFDVFATLPYFELLFTEEINRIIWENLPNTAHRIKKSNGTEDSAIATFDNQQIEWRRINEIKDAGITRQLSGELGIFWQKQKT